MCLCNTRLREIGATEVYEIKRYCPGQVFNIHNEKKAGLAIYIEKTCSSEKLKSEQKIENLPIGIQQAEKTLNVLMVYHPPHKKHTVFLEDMRN